MRPEESGRRMRGRNIRAGHLVQTTRDLKIRDLRTGAGRSRRDEAGEGRQRGGRQRKEDKGEGRPGQDGRRRSGRGPGRHVSMRTEDDRKAGGLPDEPGRSLMRPARSARPGRPISPARQVSSGQGRLRKPGGQMNRQTARLQTARRPGNLGVRGSRDQGRSRNPCTGPCEAFVLRSPGHGLPALSSPRGRPKVRAGPGLPSFRRRAARDSCPRPEPGRSGP